MGELHRKGLANSLLFCGSVFWGAACSELAPVYLPAPVLEAGQSALLLASQEGDVRAFAIEPGSVLRFEDFAESASSPMELHALVYACPLSRLSLAEGRVASSVLPPPSRVLGLGADQSTWQPAAMPAGLLERAEIAIDTRAPCYSFRRSFVKLPGSTGRQSILVKVDPDRVLIGTQESRFYTLGPNGLEDFVGLSTSTPHGASYLGPDGDVWLFDPGGTVVRGHPDRGFEEAPRAPFRGGSVWVDGSAKGAPLEIFAVVLESWSDKRGELWRFWENEWTLFATYPFQSEAGLWSAVKWLGPGRALVGLPDVHAILEVTDGTTIREIPFPAATDRPTAFALDPSGGVLVGTLVGSTWRYANGELTAIVDRLGSPAGYVTQLLPFEDRVLASGEGAPIEQLGPSLECQSLSLGPRTASRVNGIVELPGRLIVGIAYLGGSFERRNGEVQTLEPIPPELCSLADAELLESP